MDYFDTYFDDDTPVPPKIGKSNQILDLNRWDISLNA
jgi:hypothetical protein